MVSSADILAGTVVVPSIERGGQNLGAVARRIDYLRRAGELESDTDSKP
jgi:hypothetical protein